MYKRLYIIGNGFDLHYGLRTSLEEFGAYVRLRDGCLANDLENLFSGNLWGDFEEALRWLSPEDLDGDPFGLFDGINRKSNAFDERVSAARSYQHEAIREVLDWLKIKVLSEDWVSRYPFPL